MFEALDVVTNRDDGTLRARIKARTTSWRRRYAAETLGAAVAIGVAAAVVSRSLIGPLSPEAFHALIATLVAFCSIYGLVSFSSLRRGLRAEGEQLVDGVLRLGIGVLAIIVGSSIANPYAWKQSQPWYGVIFWGANGLALAAITVNQWQLEIGRLRHESGPRVQSAATNHGLVLLVAAGAASTLTAVAFIDPGLLPAAVFTVCLWILAGLSLTALVAIQLEETFPRFAPGLRKAALWASVVAILFSVAALVFLWGDGSFWSRLAPIAILTVIGIVTASLVLEEVRPLEDGVRPPTPGKRAGPTTREPAASPVVIQDGSGSPQRPLEGVQKRRPRPPT